MDTITTGWAEDYTEFFKGFRYGDIIIMGKRDGIMDQMVYFNVVDGDMHLQGMRATE